VHLPDIVSWNPAPCPLVAVLLFLLLLHIPRILATLRTPFLQTHQAILLDSPDITKGRRESSPGPSAGVATPLPPQLVEPRPQVATQPQDIPPGQDLPCQLLLYRRPMMQEEI